NALASWVIVIPGRSRKPRGDPLGRPVATNEGEAVPRPYRAPTAPAPRSGTVRAWLALLMLRDTGLLDHGGPFAHVALDALRHLVRRAASHLHAELSRLLLRIGSRQHRVDRGGEDLDDFPGRRGRSGNAVPAHDLEVLDTALIDGWDLGQIGCSFRAGGG